MADLTEYIAIAEKVVEGVEQLSMYWDAKGLDMHIAVREGSPSTGAVIVVSTKHWTRVHYVNTGMGVDGAWDGLTSMAKTISRTLVISTKGPYVYIPKLSAAQTQNVFNHIVHEVDEVTDHEVTVTRVWEMSWEIDDAVAPPGSEMGVA